MPHEALLLPLRHARRLFLRWQGPKEQAARPAHWHGDTDATGPCIVLMHGMQAGPHMARHWLRTLREWGYRDSHLYSPLHPLGTLVADLAAAHQRGQPIVLMGFSQGGFAALQLARLLDAHGTPVALLVMMASGGLGRVHPARWGFEARLVPANVRRAVHAYALGDRLGTDARRRTNALRASNPATHLHTIELPHGVAHLGLSVSASDRVIPHVAARVVAPVKQWLDDLGRLGSGH